MNDKKIDFDSLDMDDLFVDNPVSEAKPKDKIVKQIPVEVEFSTKDTITEGYWIDGEKVFANYLRSCGIQSGERILVKYWW